MYYPIGEGPLFRVASASSGNLWPDPVLGEGAYYVEREGNRYSVAHQLTVYCGEDPLVAITEAAFYQALNWQQDIASSRFKAVTYPLRSEHLLWAFRIDPRPPVIDMESPMASRRFAYSPHVLLNPCRMYTATQAIANEVRTYPPPGGSGEARPEGMKVPSARTPCVTGRSCRRIGEPASQRPAKNAEEVRGVHRAKFATPRHSLAEWTWPKGHPG